MFDFLWPQKSVVGQVVLITSGVMGLGCLMSLNFARLVQEIGKAEGDAHLYRMDITNKKKVYAGGKAVFAKFGAVDTLVNNAGIVGGMPLTENSDVIIEKTMAMNATAHFWTLKAFLSQMLARNSDHIVSIASAAGIFGCGGMVDYGASTFAADRRMVNLRQELETMQKDGVTSHADAAPRVRRRADRALQLVATAAADRHVRSGDAAEDGAACRRPRTRALLPCRTRDDDVQADAIARHSQERLGARDEALSTSIVM